MERRRRHRRRDKPPVVPNKPAAGVAAASCTVHNIPDHVLELILLRLKSSVCLVRAASTCKQWCRVVADAGFQHRFRVLRLVLGHFVSRLGLPAPVFVPSPTQSIHSRESLSLDFVPKIDGHWTIADSRNGLLLLLKKGGTVRNRRFNPDLVACNPLTRRYEAISYPPELPSARLPCLGLFLLETGRPGLGRGVSLSNFKVMAVTLRDHRLVRGRGVPAACVYSGNNWHDVSCPWEDTIDVPNQIGSFFFAGRANGSLYWGIVSGSACRAALVLDEATAGVSQIAVPGIMHKHGKYEAFFRVIGSEDGTTLRAVRLLDHDVRVHARLHGRDKWVLQTRVRLPVDDTNVAKGGPVVVAAHETYVLVSAEQSNKWLFSVDLRTKAVERVRRRDVYHNDRAYPYEQQWPPTLTASLS